MNNYKVIAYSVRQYWFLLKEHKPSEVGITRRLLESATTLELIQICNVRGRKANNSALENAIIKNGTIDLGTLPDKPKFLKFVLWDLNKFLKTKELVGKKQVVGYSRDCLDFISPEDEVYEPMYKNVNRFGDITVIYRNISELVYNYLEEGYQNRPIFCKGRASEPVRGYSKPLWCNCKLINLHYINEEYIENTVHTQKDLLNAMSEVEEMNRKVYYLNSFIKEEDAKILSILRFFGVDTEVIDEEDSRELLEFYCSYRGFEYLPLTTTEDILELMIAYKAIDSNQAAYLYENERVVTEETEDVSLDTTNADGQAMIDRVSDENSAAMFYARELVPNRFTQTALDLFGRSYVDQAVFSYCKVKGVRQALLGSEYDLHHFNDGATNIDKLYKDSRNTIFVYDLNRTKFKYVKDCLFRANIPYKWYTNDKGLHVVINETNNPRDRVVHRVDGNTVNFNYREEFTFNPKEHCFSSDGIRSEYLPSDRKTIWEILEEKDLNIEYHCKSDYNILVALQKRMMLEEGIKPNVLEFSEYNEIHNKYLLWKPHNRKFTWVKIDFDDLKY